ncbi:MAG: fumarate hydratase C-terminal domain-containing protein [Coriobacteriia bacterium]|nr:fumarate hydratase C-terminal domain-containing protein [Coriobacteriia bacterium]
MPEATRIVLPEEASVLRTLKAGDEVALFGVLFTARDATHVRLADELERLGELPYGLAGNALLYAGPTPPRPGWPAGAVGPTTARRMDAWTPALLRAGIVATIGKGPRSEEVRLACAETGAVYLAAVGGAAALLGGRVVSATTVAYPELGTEALVRLEVDGLPAFVAIDAEGGDLYAQAAREWRVPSG